MIVEVTVRPSFVALTVAIHCFKRNSFIGSSKLILPSFIMISIFELLFLVMVQVFSERVYVKLVSWYILGHFGNSPCGNASGVF